MVHGRRRSHRCAPRRAGKKEGEKAYDEDRCRIVNESAAHWGRGPVVWVGGGLADIKHRGRRGGRNPGGLGGGECYLGRFEGYLGGGYSTAGGLYRGCGAHVGSCAERP